MRKRVYLYIVRRNEVLVIRHVDFPELGLQIPGGTVESNEAPIDAAAREALEETGLAELGSPMLLGVTAVQSERAYEHTLEAWFFRIKAEVHTPNLWLHTEQHASVGDNRVRFELSWIPKKEVAKLLSAADCLMLDVV